MLRKVKTVTVGETFAGKSRNAYEPMATVDAPLLMITEQIAERSNDLPTWTDIDILILTQQRAENVELKERVLQLESLLKFQTYFSVRRDERSVSVGLSRNKNIPVYICKYA